LEQFCPEIIYVTPHMLGGIRHGKHKYVTHCQSLSKANMFVLAVYDRSNKSSFFEIYSFRRVGVVSDKFLLRSPSEKQDDLGGGSRMSLIDMDAGNVDMDQNID
jgi:hypothetical protein